MMNEGIIAVYPSTFYQTKQDAESLAELASLGLPWIGEHDTPLKVSRAWVVGDEQSGKVYATFLPRTEKLRMTMLEWLKERELERK